MGTLCEFCCCCYSEHLFSMKFLNFTNLVALSTCITVWQFLLEKVSTERTSKRPSNSSLSYIFKRIEKRYSIKYMYTHIQQHYSQQPEKCRHLKWPLMDEWINKIHSYTTGYYSVTERKEALVVWPECLHYTSEVLPCDSRSPSVVYPDICIHLSILIISMQVVAHIFVSPGQSITIFA